MPLTQVGRNVRVIQDVQLFTDDCLRAGETGTVTAIHPDTGEVWVTLHKRHDCLSVWDNTLSIFPPGHPEHGGMCQLQEAFEPLDTVSLVECLSVEDYIQRYLAGELSPSIVPALLKCG